MTKRESYNEYKRTESQIASTLIAVAIFAAIAVISLILSSNFQAV